MPLYGQRTINPIHPGVNTSNYYFPAGAVGAATPSTLTAGVVYYTLLIVPNTTTYTKIGAKVTSSVAASTMRFGIYQNSNGLPTSLIADYGTVTSASTGDQEITISQTLEPNCYWIAMQPSGAIAINWFLCALGHSFVGANSSAGTDFSLFNGPISVAALAATAPAISKTAVSTGFVPGFWVRK